MAGSTPHLMKKVHPRNFLKALHRVVILWMNESKLAIGSASWWRHSRSAPTNPLRWLKVLVAELYNVALYWWHTRMLQTFAEGSRESTENYQKFIHSNQLANANPNWFDRKIFCYQPWFTRRRSIKKLSSDVCCPNSCACSLPPHFIRWLHITIVGWCFSKFSSKWIVIKLGRQSFSISEAIQERRNGVKKVRLK